MVNSIRHIQIIESVNGALSMDLYFVLEAPVRDQLDVTCYRTPRAQYVCLFVTNSFNTSYQEVVKFALPVRREQDRTG